MAKVIQADRARAAEALGYRDWDDATDYRQTGAAQREVHELAGAFASHREASTAKLEADLEVAVEALQTIVNGLHGKRPCNRLNAARGIAGKALTRIQGEYRSGDEA